LFGIVFVFSFLLFLSIFVIITAKSDAQCFAKN
jgi:hypothetical protein